MREVCHEPRVVGNRAREADLGGEPQKSHPSIHSFYQQNLGLCAGPWDST